MSKFFVLIVLQFLKAGTLLAQQETGTANPERVYKISKFKRPVTVDGN
jgi:hypothetical protein